MFQVFDQAKEPKLTQSAYRCFQCSNLFFESVYTLKYHMLTKHCRTIRGQIANANFDLQELSKFVQPATDSDAIDQSKKVSEHIKVIVHEPTPSIKKCPVCYRSFTIDGKLYFHLLTKHRPKILTALVCDICGKSFASRKNLGQHQIFCGKPRKGPVCEYCGLQCLTNTHLKRHLYVHTGTSQFTCQICEKKFATQRSLKNHTLLHTGHKPFKCEVCRKAFSEVSMLKNHRCGIGRLSQECKKCKGIFSSKKMLERHNCTTV